MKTNGKLSATMFTVQERETGPVSFTPPALGYPDIQIGSAPAMATFNNYLYIAFQANDPSHSLFLTSAASGVTIFNHPAARVIPVTAIGSAPAMAAVNGRLYIAFQADDPSHRLVIMSSPDGSDWTNPGPRLTIPGIAIGSAPAVAAFNNRLYIAFQADGGSNALFVASSADGLNFTTPVLVDPEIGVQTSSRPAMTVFNNQLYISLQDSSPFPGVFHHLVVTSSVDGVHFTNPARGFSGILMGSGPAMTALGGRLYISFQADDPGQALFVTSSADGVNFTTPATGYPGILLGSAPASGEFGQRLWVAFQADDPSHILFVAASSPVANAQ